MRNFIICSQANEGKDNEVGGGCGMRGRGERSAQDFGGKGVKARRTETTWKTKA
jgi:hypothetical protein